MMEGMGGFTFLAKNPKCAPPQLSYFHPSIHMNLCMIFDSESSGLWHTTARPHSYPIFIHPFI
jgi:hypothetical protein